MRSTTPVSLTPAVTVFAADGQLLEVVVNRVSEFSESEQRIPHDAQYEKDHIPESHHGTHVAGILAADWRPDDDRYHWPT